MTAAEREAEIARLTGKLNAIDLEIWLERRQIDRLLSRLGVLVRPTPKPRYRQLPVAARAEDSANPSSMDARVAVEFRKAQPRAAARRTIVRAGTGQIVAIG